MLRGADLFLYSQVRCRINTKTSYPRHLTNAVSPFVRLVLEGYASNSASLCASTSCCSWKLYISALSASRMDSQRAAWSVARSSRASLATLCVSTVVLARRQRAPLYLGSFMLLCCWRHAESTRADASLVVN